MKHRVTTGQAHFDHQEGEPLLASLTPLGHYSECRNGYCGACKTTLLSGQVRYLTPPIAYTRPGEILPCCCTPVSDLLLVPTDLG